MITLEYNIEPELFKIMETLDKLLVGEFNNKQYFLWQNIPLYYYDGKLFIKKLSYVNNKIIKKDDKFIIEFSDDVQLIKRDIVDDNNYRLIIHELHFIYDEGFKDDVELKIINNKLIEIDGFNLVELFKEALIKTIKQKWN